VLAENEPAQLFGSWAGDNLLLYER
jgi:hypothetical protein